MFQTHELQMPLPPLKAKNKPTFSVDTKSAVSNRVNWLIWSTIVAILGFASPDAHLRCILCCVAPIVGRMRAAGLAVQMHRLKARDAGADMVLWRLVAAMGRCACLLAQCRVVPS
jgi:hypothetical protein